MATHHEVIHRGFFQSTVFWSLYFDFFEEVESSFVDDKEHTLTSLCITGIDQSSQSGDFEENQEEGARLRWGWRCGIWSHFPKIFWSMLLFSMYNCTIKALHAWQLWEALLLFQRLLSYRYLFHPKNLESPEDEFIIAHIQLLTEAEQVLLSMTGKCNSTSLVFSSQQKWNQYLKGKTLNEISF